MGLPAARVGDMSTGHDFHPPHPISKSKITTVKINGRAPSHVLAHLTDHSHRTTPQSGHNSRVIEGSKGVLMEGLKPSTVGHEIQCYICVAKKDEVILDEFGNDIGWFECTEIIEVVKPENRERIKTGSHNVLIGDGDNED